MTKAIARNKGETPAKRQKTGGKVAWINSSQICKVLRLKALTNMRLKKQAPGQTATQGTRTKATTTVAVLTKYG